MDQARNFQSFVGKYVRLVVVVCSSGSRTSSLICCQEPNGSFVSCDEGICYYLLFPALSVAPSLEFCRCFDGKCPVN